MTNEHTIMLVIGIGIAVVGGIWYLIPGLVRRGIDVGSIIAAATAGLAQADVITDTLLEAAPDNAGLLVVDKLTGWAQRAVMAAEQLYKAHELKGDERKKAAVDMVHQFAEAAGIKVTDPLDGVIKGSIEAAVYVLPKTGQAEPKEPEKPPEMEKPAPTL
jgi:Phage holin protein (Holin_LLH).